MTDIIHFIASECNSLQPLLASRKNAICDGSGKSAASHSAGRGLRPAPQSPHWPCKNVRCVQHPTRDVTPPRRWSFQLRHADAARCRTSLCLRTAQRPPSSPLQPLQGAARRPVSPCRMRDASDLLTYTYPFPLLNSQTPRLPAAKTIPVPMGSSAKSPVKRPFRGVCPSPRLEAQQQNSTIFRF